MYKIKKNVIKFCKQQSLFFLLLTSTVGFEKLLEFLLKENTGGG